MTKFLFALLAVAILTPLPTTARVIKIYSYNGPSRKVLKPVVIPTDSVAGYPNLKVGSITWASVNVDDSGKFATKPDMHSKFYQWNRGKAWDETTPNRLTEWEANITDATWTINPCPEGWRLPTRDELEELGNAGYAWVEAYARGNSVAGGIFGSNFRTCSLSGSMEGCIFIAASGGYDEGARYSYQGASMEVWSSTQLNSTTAYGFTITDVYTDSDGNDNLGGLIFDSACKSCGFNIRCVK